MKGPTWSTLQETGKDPLSSLSLFTTFCPPCKSVLAIQLVLVEEICTWLHFCTLSFLKCLLNIYFVWFLKGLKALDVHVLCLCADLCSRLWGQTDKWIGDRPRSMEALSLERNVTEWDTQDGWHLIKLCSRMHNVLRDPDPAWRMEKL